METWIVRIARQRAGRRVSAWIFGVVVVLLALASQVRYFSNFVSGPFDLSPADLVSIQSVDEAPHYFARVHGGKAIDTGLQQFTVRTRNGRETGRSVSGGYYALTIGDDNRLLLMKSAHGGLTTVEGELKPIPAEISAKLFDTPEMLTVRERFFPFYLDEGSFRQTGYALIGGALAFLALLAVFGRRAWRQWRDPSSHPVVQRAESWGSQAEIATDVERELERPRHQGSGWLITDNYLVKRSFFGFDVLRLADLMWGYKQVTQRRVNFVPAGKSYTAELKCRGGNASLRGPEARVDDMLRFVGQRSPWAVFGYSADIVNIWRRDNAAFCAGVDQRRNTMHR